MLPSEKNCASVMPKPLQIISSVATEGVVLRLKMLATVDWESPDIVYQYSVCAPNTCMTLPVSMTVWSVTRTYSLPPGTWTSMSVSLGL